ncbi:hypothetical protein KSP39_PZI017423 [Platanthera zijinensis]|uniref:Pentatricopeptide repeat-containing protein n=1 Tax=Platanthera zijinensis TaxID=2320716 RepID=A0AAP0B5I0_9ASPA
MIMYSSLVRGLSREGRVVEAIDMLHELHNSCLRLSAVIYNSVLLGLCKARRTERAIGFYAYMVSRGCMPTESTYMILIEGLVHEDFCEEAADLLDKLYSGGVVRKASFQNVVVIFNWKDLESS